MGARGVNLTSLYDYPLIAIRDHSQLSCVSLPAAESTMVIRNHLRGPLTVMDRFGVPLTLVRQEDSGAYRVEIEVTILLNARNRDETDRFLSQLDVTNKSRIKKLLKEAWLANKRVIDTNVPLEIKLFYTITEAQFDKYGGTFYHHYLDRVFSCTQSASEVRHPYSEEELLRHETNRVASRYREAGAFFGIEIIDNHGTYGDRFMCFSKEVIRVKAVKDPAKKDGIYIRQTRPALSEQTAPEIIARYYPIFDEKGAVIEHEELFLFPSYAQALAMGDLELTRKQELAEREFERRKTELENQLKLLEQKTGAEARKWEVEEQRLKMELNHLKEEFKLKEEEHRQAREKLEGERQKAEHERQKLWIEREKLEMELKRLKEKDEYESRAQKRKDRSEWVKGMSTLIVAVISLASLIVNLMKK